MGKLRIRLVAPLVVVALTTVFTAATSANAQAVAKSSTTATATSTGLSVTSQAMLADLPSKADQIAALTTALANINAKLNPPPPGRASTRYGSGDLRDIYSYKVNQLWLQGIDGAGTTIAVMEGWEDPTIGATIHTLDAAIGLPDPPNGVETIYPNGPLPAVCPAGMVALGSYGSCSAWKGELDLDVEMVHLMAPYANIIVSATPSDTEIVGDASSEVAMPEIPEGMEYIANNHLADAMSVSDGSSETDYSNGKPEIVAQDAAELTAAADGVPVINATGDCGAAQNLTTAASQCGAVSSGPASATWGDSPFVLAIGGVSPRHTAPCPPCTTASGEDSFPLDSIEGAGLSEIYARPAYQNGIAAITGSSQRSMPDLTMNSADGTSEAAPEMGGVIALATQAFGKDLGAINQILYTQLAQNPAANGLVDVTSGSNTFGSTAKHNLVPGYSAAPGYDVASGWGTVDASLFVPALAQAESNGNPMTAQAQAQLTALENTVQITPSTTLAPTATADVTSTGFLPHHPVTFSIDGTPVPASPIAADTSGNVLYSFTGNELGLAAGQHTLTLHSMLLNQSINFTIGSATQPAAPVITSPSTGVMVGSGSPTISGTGATFTPSGGVATGDTVTVTDESGNTVCTATVDPTAKTWSCVPSTPFGPGVHVLHATQTDGTNGNSVPSVGVSFTVATATASEQVTTTVTQQGALTMSIANAAPVVLPTPTLTPDAHMLTSTGSMNPVTILDTRTFSPGWNCAGQISLFTSLDGAGTMAASDLGWVPVVIDQAIGENVVPGGTVTPGVNGGLGTSKQLASAAAGVSNGTADIGATLNLLAPTTTPFGTYTATMTLTAI